MGLYLFRLPDIGEGVAEAEIVALLVKVGDVVEEDQNLAEVMTDKATVELSSPVAGTVTAVHGEIGGMLPVGAVLVEFESEAGGDQAVAAPASPPSAPPIPEPVPTTPAPAPAPAPASRPAASSGRPAGDGPLAAPSTRRRALDLGVSLAQVPGSGPGGRITPEDLDAFLASDGENGGGSGLVPRTGVHDTRIIGLRRKIAEKMQEA
ncbi:MAG: catalytic domain of component of various dehydrogenase complexe, partial [Caulobacter sp.]|nr:catalytic domain of component of various dehydrogenase complexe [Caulobacter sp.]